MGMVQPIHPFPARMAAEIALEVLGHLPPGSRVLDPMAGSGTVLRAAIAGGHNALGFDRDPLAVLMARVWTTPIDAAALREAAAAVAAEAVGLAGEPRLAWIDDDRETGEFVRFWFGERQRRELRRLAWVLAQCAEGEAIGEALKLALSRIIVTKERGASLARDVSHSRPHRTFVEHDFAVLPAFVRSAGRLATLLEATPPPGGAVVRLGDARRLTAVEVGAIDAAITSPPYLNAIDYLRGHRLALVWLGHRIGELRAIRAGNIGSERGPEPGSEDTLAAGAVREAGLEALPVGLRRMVDRYARDLVAFVGELARVLRPGGVAVCVVGNSCVRGHFVENDRLLAFAAEGVGLQATGRRVREIPPSRRYLPPPASGGAVLAKRMRTESVLTFVRS